MFTPAYARSVCPHQCVAHCENEILIKFLAPTAQQVSSYGGPLNMMPSARVSQYTLHVLRECNIQFSSCPTSLRHFASFLITGKQDTEGTSYSSSLDFCVWWFPPHDDPAPDWATPSWGFALWWRPAGWRDTSTLLSLLNIAYQWHLHGDWWRPLWKISQGVYWASHLRLL